MKRPTKSWKTAAPAAAVLLVLLSGALGWSGSASAQQPARGGAGAEGLDVQKLRDDVYLIAGAGSNIVAQVGPIGVILVDSGTTEAAPRVLAAIRRLTPLPVRYIINTSMDRDHVGGNDVLTSSGLSILPGAVVAGAGLSDSLVSNAGKASVLAHENVQTRMSEATGAAAYPFALWPTKTFAFHAYSMYLNGEGYQVVHQPAAHTDGDVIVALRRSDVIATGDLIDTTRFPVIDVARGGSVQGLLDALNRLMDMTIYNLPIQWNDDRTLLVPGHGRVYDKLDLLEYRDAITVVRDRVQDLIKDGKNLQQVKAANPTLGYRSEYGTDRGEWTTDMFVETIFKELSRETWPGGREGELMRARTIVAIALAAAVVPLQAQRGGGPPAGPPKAVAPIDLTGYWVSIVSMDWRWRMVTPAKGDYAGVPMNAASKTVADAWDPAKDEAAGEQCKSYGAPAIMSVPGRLHITWQDDSTLKIETDAGQQTRLVQFGPVPPVKPPRSWQGMSAAQWQMSAPGLPLMLRPQDRAADAPLPPPVRGGTLKVTTTNLRAGYLRKNGVPYSADAVLTEYYDLTKNGNDTLLTVTTIVDDPTYLRTRRLIAYPFKKEANGDKWDPTPCSARW